MSMKKAIILAICLWFISSNTHAQTLSYGPEVGINFNRFTTDEAGYGSTFKPGLRVGMNLNLPIARRSFIATGFYFNQKGQSRVFQDAGMDKKEFHTTNYFQVPVNYSHRIKFKQKGSAMLIGGVYVGYGVTGRHTIYGNDAAGIYTEMLKEEISWGNGANEFRRLDMGINLGVAYEFPFGFYGKALFAQGIIPITNNNIHDKFQQSIQLCLGLNFWTWIN